MKLKIPKFTKKDLKNVSRSSLILNTLAILVVVNIIAAFFAIRLDLTQNKDFSLSKVTLNTLKSLDDVVAVKVFLSENLPSAYLPLKQRIKDTVTQYEKESRGKIKVTYIDPKNDPDLINQAMSLGIPQLQFSDVQNDKFSVSAGFIGIAITYTDKKESIQTVSDNTNLEHDLTAAIKKVTAKESPLVGIVSGHGETDDTKATLVRQVLQKDFDVTSVEITDKEDQDLIKDNIKTLVLINPTQKFGQRALFVLDQFLMNGGSVVLLEDGINISNNLQPTQNETNINDLIEKYGVKVNDDLVLSADSELASFSTGTSNIVVQYPFWIRLLKQDLNQSFPATANLDLAVLPWASSLTIDKGKQSDAKILEIAKSSKTSLVQSGNSINVDPSSKLSPKKEDLKQSTVAVVVSGKLKSAFKDDKEISKILKKDETKIDESTKDARLLVISDSDFVGDFFLRRYSGNAALFLNSVDSVTSDVSLAEIRVKGSSFRPLKEVSDSTRNLIKWGNILIIPLAAVVLGVLRLVVRGK